MSTLGNFVWGIADALRGPYKPHQYGDVILPMTILRRLDAILAPTRAEVAKLVAANPVPDVASARIKQQLGLGFYNTSQWTLVKLLGWQGPPAVWSPGTEQDDPRGTVKVG